MDKMEDILSWALAALVSAGSAIVAYLYKSLNSKVEDVEDRGNEVEKDAVGTKQEIKNLRDTFDLKHEGIITRLEHIRELIESRNQ